MVDGGIGGDSRRRGERKKDLKKEKFDRNIYRTDKFVN